MKKNVASVLSATCIVLLLIFLKDQPQVPSTEIHPIEVLGEEAPNIDDVVLIKINHIGFGIIWEQTRVTCEVVGEWELNKNDLLYSQSEISDSHEINEFFSVVKSASYGNAKPYTPSDFSINPNTVITLNYRDGATDRICMLQDWFIWRNRLYKNNIEILAYMSSIVPFSGLDTLAFFGIDSYESGILH